ncbi:PspC domain-containing protein [Alkalihalophilus lindianensis]|uniref:PspC domain-containing protein n=1 Tax=Alkalihalophilus lindianensis TaxID=1630542 RepID=A0ABU3XG34_9BACI|nr:PspC domain-containing protein [Alkalihalophilus lindianensis]MDV2686788.1 PspC domain-containing protein [Alkalihalophilus lindianensis]
MSGVYGLKNKLRKSSTDKSITGVCGGIAEYFGISSFAVRLIFIFLPANILIYLILTNAMSDSPPSL